MSSQMSSQEVENNQIVLQSKDLRQLMGLASLDMKLNKNAILKINISEALSLVNRSIGQIEIRLYGNVVFSIFKGILKTLNVITLDLKETIDLMRKNIKLGRKEETVARFPKLPKQEKPQLPSMTPTESERDVSTVEKVRNISKEDNITLRDILTSGGRLPEMDFSHDSVLGRGFAEELGGMETGGLEYLSEPGGRPLSFGGEHIQFEISTPSRIGEFISPRKQKQAFTNLDAYLESVKKEERPIFRDLTQPDEEEKTTKKKKDEARRRKSRKVEFTAELETRWDYDEKLDIEKPEEVKEKTDADTFIDKVQAPTAMPIQQRLSVNLDHFMDAFSTDKLAQFNEKVKSLREEQLPIPRRQTTGRKAEEESIERFGPFEYQPEDQFGFPMQQGSDIDEIPHLAPLEEKSQIIGEGSIFQVGRLEEIGLSLDRERFDENLSITEVFDNIKSMEKEQKKKDKKSKLTFENLSKNESKPGKASMFYEVLNLAKENKVILSQTKNYFGDIEIEVV